MMRRSIVFLMVTVQACWHSSLDEQRWFESLQAERPGAGVSRTFSANAATTLQAAEDAVAAAGLYQDRTCPGPTATDVNPPCGAVAVVPFGVGTLGFYAFPDRRHGWNGRQVRVVVEGRGPNETIVRIISKEGTTTVTHGSGDYSHVIFDGISELLSARR